MESPTQGTDYAARAARAYERVLREQVAHYGSPPTPPEVAGQRAAVLATAGQAWSHDIGPFHDSAGAAIALGGITKQAVSQRVQAGRLLGLRLAPDGTHRERLVYPVWQFHPTVLTHLPAVLQSAGYDPHRAVTGWVIAAWLTTPDPALGHRTPVQLLRAGHADQVTALASEVARSLGAQERRAAHREAAAQAQARG